MAKLICKDGTEVEIGDETEANLREKFGKPKEFKKIELCHLRIAVIDSGYVRLSWKGTNEKTEWCSEAPYSIQHTIECLQSAIDYIKNR